MPRGGRRAGAGRKPGSVTKRTAEAGRAEAARGITPLEVMVIAMRHYYDQGNYDRAAAIARDAAPYIHPRLSSMQISGGETPIRLEVVEEIIGVPDSDPKANGEAASGAAGLPSV